MSRSFAGAGTALVTPFTKAGALDEPALRRLVRRQVDAHIDVLVPCGTTGEAATMTVDEQKRVVAITLEEAGKVPVRAGRGARWRGPRRGRSPAAALLRRRARGHRGLGTGRCGPPHHLPALRDHRGRGVRARRGLQRAQPHRQQHRHQDPAPPGRASEHHRGQGGLRQTDPGDRHPARPAGGFEVLSGDDANTVTFMALGGKA